MRPGSTMFDHVEFMNHGDLKIETPEGLPLNMKTELDQYNDAIGRFDIEEAEGAADKILQWLHRYGMAGYDRGHPGSSVVRLVPVPPKKDRGFV